MKRDTMVLLFALAIVCLFPGATMADLEDGLVAFYPFNGNANDESGNGNHGTIVGENIALTTDRFGFPDRAYEFSTDLYQFIEIADSPDFDFNPSVTFAAWICLNSYIDDNRTIISKYTEGAEHKTLGINYYVAPRRAYLFLYPVFHPDYPPEYQGPQTVEEIPLNEWVHVAATYDGSVGKIYFNGAVSGECIRSGDPADAGGILRIGPNWDGKIDDVRIYNRALSDEEIQGLYTLGKLTLINPANGAQLATAPLFEWSSEEHNLFGLYLYLPIWGSYYPIPNPPPIWTSDTHFDLSPYTSVWGYTSLGVWAPWAVVGVNTYTGDWDVVGPLWFSKTSP